MVTSEPPPEPGDAGDDPPREPLEAEIDELTKRFDPVPEAVVTAARRAFDRGSRRAAPEAVPPDDTNDAPIDDARGDSRSDAT
jgi:hypothetical protein